MKSSNIEISENSPVPEYDVTVGRSRQVNELSLYELCRWAALKDAVDVIGDKCDERGIDFEKFTKLDSLAIFKFVERSTDKIFEKFQKVD